MAKKQQTHAKRAREVALRERRERKQAKKAEAAAQRAAGGATPVFDSAAPGAEGNGGIGATDWIQ